MPRLSRKGKASVISGVIALAAPAFRQVNPFSHWTIANTPKREEHRNATDPPGSQGVCRRRTFRAAKILIIGAAPPERRRPRSWRRHIRET